MPVVLKLISVLDLDSSYLSTLISVNHIEVTIEERENRGERRLLLTDARSAIGQ
jgi:hypothetical protein